MNFCQQAFSILCLLALVTTLFLGCQTPRPPIKTESELPPTEESIPSITDAREEPYAPPSESEEREPTPMEATPITDEDTKPSEDPAPTTPPTQDPPVTPPTSDTPVARPDTTSPAPETTLPTTPPDTEKDTNAVNDVEREVVTLINDIRHRYGLSPLTLSEELSAVAKEKSRDMYRLGYFDHTSPTYGSPFDMMHSFGISYRAAGENIAMGYPTPSAVVEGWMNSEGHRANILNPAFTTIGMGYEENGHYWTQMFIG